VLVEVAVAVEVAVEVVVADVEEIRTLTGNGLLFCVIFVLINI
jgi:hypothetical protein